jgi:hypothetical protein
MAGLNWNEFLVIALLALCVLGPICVVLLTQNLLDSADEVAPEHFDFDATAGNSAGKRPTSRKDGGNGGDAPANHHDR